MSAITTHYSDGRNLAEAIAARLRESGKDLQALTPLDLASVDEFHIRGRKATLALVERMRLSESSRVLDIGSGLGGPARTLAQTYGCMVTGIDLTPAYCEAAQVMSQWVKLADKTNFHQADATQLPFVDHAFDAAMSIHVGMNVRDKASMYREAHRVLKPGSIFAIYDVLRGEGEVMYPVPWAREHAISHLASTNEMTSLLTNAGFHIAEVIDSTADSASWFAAMTEKLGKANAKAVTLATVLGEDFAEMTRNQVRNLAEGRVRTVSFICEARS